MVHKKSSAYLKKKIWHYLQIIGKKNHEIDLFLRISRNLVLNSACSYPKLLFFRNLFTISNLKYSRVRYEFNRPYLEAKDYQDNDALAVEATAYALETIFLMEGISRVFYSKFFHIFSLIF